MSVSAVVEAIEHGREMLEDPYDLLKIEAYNRYITIDPIIRALGWKTEDPAQLMVEWPRGKKPRRWVDYALFDPYENIVALIEAKGLGKVSRNPNRQISKYLQGRRSNRLIVAAVTDGRTWHLINLEDGGLAGESEHVDICSNKRIAAQTLNRWLRKDNWW